MNIDLKIIQSDKILNFIRNFDDNDLDNLCEVSLDRKYIDKLIYDTKIGTNLKLTLAEFLLNRILLKIFVELLSDDDICIGLNKFKKLKIVPDNKKIQLYIYKFDITDFSFESTDMDNNTRQYSFYYQIKDLVFEDQDILIKGRFDINVTVDYCPEAIKDDFEPIEDKDFEHYNVSYDIFNDIRYNRYITKENSIEDEKKIIDAKLTILNKIVKAYIEDDEIIRSLVKIIV